MRNLWKNGIRFRSQTAFAIAVSLVWVAFYNFTFWGKTIEAMWYPGASSALFIASLFVLVVTVQATLLLLVPTGRGLQIAASVLFVVGALSAYFSDNYGAIMNRDMLRNVVQTDPAEVRGLISAGLISHFLFFGILPAVLVWRVNLPRTGILRELRQRGIFLAVAWLVCAGGLFAASANYAVFLRQHKPLRSLVAPTAAVVSVISVVAGNDRTQYQGPLLDPGGSVQRVGPKGAKPAVVFLVIGETARAANFELGGYPRATNPELREEQGLVYFDHATSCGTSTTISVPCMFSPLGRTGFKVGEAGRYANLLDTLTRAGVGVQWRDNNAGCKGVCKRVDTIIYKPHSDPDLCPQSYCFDEVMLKDLDAKLRNLTRDTVIVFHQIGSHGPAYAERYPPQFERFQPTCRSNELDRCASQQIVNAYDNSIVYSDHVLSRQIDMLRNAADVVDGALIYASDHGESLGEQGVYLHGMPYTFAPRFQKEIPMLVWTSDAYQRRLQLDEGCLRAQAHREVSHDNLYHTVLGMLGVRNRVYDPKLDLLAACRPKRLISAPPAVE